MKACTPTSKSQIHRHTGGLENHGTFVTVVLVIHRHTGGLEKPA